MTGRDEADTAGDAIDSPSHPPAGRQPLTQEQVGLWARLVAEGRGEISERLSAADRRRVEAEVRSRLRDSLLRLIARAIAADIADGPQDAGRQP